jgi:VWFA-related protein
MPSRAVPATSLALAAFALALTRALTAQTTPPAQAPQGPPVFRSQTELVHLDVSVLDQDRRPVRGLTAADFTILEDGKPQSVAAFAAVDVPQAPPPTAAWIHDVAPDVRTNEVARQPDARLIVILIDDAMIPQDLGAIKNAKSIARGVIDRLSPIDQAAVVFSKGSLAAQDFTSDRARLRASVEALNAGYARYTLGWDMVDPVTGLPVMDNDAGLRQDSMRTLQFVAETLIAAPQRRKILVHVSPGITADWSSVAAPGNIRRAQTMALVEANKGLVAEMPGLLRRMQQANVTMYPVDPCGLGGLESYVMGVAAGVPALQRGAPTPLDYHWLAPTFPPHPTYLGRHFANVHLDFMNTVAEQTNGLAVVNTNDFDTGLDRVFNENSSYYLLGYRPATRHRPGTLHRLTVRVNSPDVRVRTRSGYETPPAETAASAARGPRVLEDAVSEPTPGGDLSMRAAVAAMAQLGRRESAVLVTLAVDRSPVAERTLETIEILVRVFTPDGRPFGDPYRHTARLSRLPRPTSATTTYELLSLMALPPGRYSLRIAAMRDGDRAAGTVFADVDVPEVWTAPLTLSDVLIEALPAAAGGPKDAFAGLVPVVPTTRRQFRRSDAATAFFRVHQGGASPLRDAMMAVTIVNDRAEVVVEGKGPLPAARFASDTRALDHRFTIPLASLAPGEYLLKFDVLLGQVLQTRQVRISLD